MSDDDRYAGLSKEELLRQYDEATRNYSAAEKARLEGNPQPDATDSPHAAHAKALYRALTPHVAGNGHFEEGGFQNHA